MPSTTLARRLIPAWYRDRRRGADRGSPARFQDRRFRLRALEGLEDRALMATVYQDLGPLRLAADAFTNNGNQYSAAGTIQVGFAPAQQADYTPLVQVVGSVSFATGTDDPVLTISGEVDALIQGGTPLALGAGMQSWDVDQLVAAGVALSGATSIGVAQVDFTPGLIAFNNPGSGDTTDSLIQLQGTLAIADLPGLSLPVGGGDYVQLSTAGIGLAANNLATSGNFTVAGVTFSGPGSLAVSYSSANDTFGFSGSVGASTAGGEVSLAGTLGTSTQPGLIIENGSLSSLSLTVGGNFTVAEVALTAVGLALDYQSSDSSFQIGAGGSVALKAGDVSFSGTFGDATTNPATPGLLIQGGKLSSLDIAVGGGVSIAGATLSVSNLAFAYAAAAGTTPQSLTVSGGSASLTAGDVTIAGTFATPGLVIQGGKLASLDITVSGGLKLAGVSFSVSDLAFDYVAGMGSNPASLQVSGGSVGFTVGDLSVSGTFATPGLVIQDGHLATLDISVTGGATVAGVALSVSDLSFDYAEATDTQPSTLTVAGGTVALAVAGSSFSGTFGSSTNPGLEIQGGKLVELQVTVTSDVTIGGVTIALTGLGLSYSSRMFTLYGSASITFADLGGASLSASLGTIDQPGLVLLIGPDQDGRPSISIDTLDVSISGNFDLGGLNVRFTDVDFSYSSTADEYTLSGTLTVSDLFDASLTLGGPDNQPGIVVQDGRFQLDNISVSVSDVSLGAFTIQDLTVAYASSPGAANDYTLTVTLSLSFPEGWSAGGSLTLVDHKIEDISVSIMASEGIEIGDTGLFIDSLSASVMNIEQPSNLVVSGSLGVSFGPAINVRGTTVALLQATGSFTVDSQQLILSASFQMAGGLLGSGSGTMNLDWGTKTYIISADLSIYDGIFTFSGEFAFSEANGYDSLTIEAKADVNVPDHIPFIGGRTLAAIDFLFEYSVNKATGAYTGLVAAWIELDIGKKFDIGIEYDFDKHLSIIGTKTVDSFNFNPSGQQNQTYSYTVTAQVPQDVTGATFQVSWPQVGGSTVLGLTFPDGTAVSQSQFASLLQIDPSLGTTAVSLVPALGSATTGAIRLMGSAADDTVILAPGTYTITFTSTVQYTAVPSIQAAYTYARPTVGVAGVSSDLRVSNDGATASVAVKVAPALAGSTTVYLYVTLSPTGYGGTLVGSMPASVDPTTGRATVTLPLPLANLLPLTYYVYAAVDDGVNARVFSDRATDSGRFVPSYSLFGGITDPYRNAPLAGVQVYYNTTGVHQDSDPIATTNALGEYGFASLPNWSDGQVFYVGVIIPDGYVFAPNNAYANPAKVTYSTSQSFQIDFNLNLTSSISGTVFDDFDRDGVQDAGDPAIVGYTVSLTRAGSNVPFETTQTNTSGFYAFYNLKAGESYTITIAPNPARYFATTSTRVQATLTPINGSPYGQATANFGLGEYATIGGTISGNALLPGTGLDPTASPLQGWTVLLYDESGALVETTISAADGSYLFTRLTGRAYSVEEKVPPGWRQTSPVQSVLGFSATPASLVTRPIIPIGQATGDFNNDGIIDEALLGYIFSGFSAESVVLVSLGNGDGTFSPLSIITLAAPLPPLQIMALASSSPGALDLFVLDRDGYVEVLQNAGGGQFSNQGRLLLATPGATGFRMAAGRFDPTIPTDVSILSYIPSFGSPGLVFDVVYPGGFFAIDLPQFSVMLPTGSTGGLVTGDFNADGYLDFLTTDSANVYTYFGAANLTFTLQVSAVFTTAQPGGGALAVGDFNDDGTLDLAVASPAAPYQTMILTLGSTLAWQPFATLPGLPAGQPILQLIASDVNGDGLVDLVELPYTPGATGANAYIFLNNRNKSTLFIATPVAIPVGVFAGSISLADFNNDGLPDIGYTDLTSPAPFSTLLNTSATTPLRNSVSLIAGQTDYLGVDFSNAQTGALPGTVFDDRNRDGRQQLGEVGLSGIAVYVDLNGNGQYDPGLDPITTTVQGGAFAFPSLPEGTYEVRVVTTGEVVLSGRGRRSVTASIPAGGAGTPLAIGLTTALLAPIAPIAAVAGTPITFLAARTDAGVAASAAARLLYRLAADSPAGARIDPATGAFSWTPTRAQANRTYAITVQIFDPYRPNFQDFRTFTVAVADVAPNVLFAEALVRDLLGTSASTAEVNLVAEALASGASRDRVVDLLWDSIGHRTRQVDLLFQAYLRRPATARERVDGIAQIERTGETTALAARILASAEYRASHPTARSYVIGLFQDVLGRAPTRRELARWLPAARTAGRRALALTFLTSREAYRRFVDGSFRDYLGRAPKKGERKALVDRLHARRLKPSVLVKHLLKSDEYYARTSLITPRS